MKKIPKTVTILGKVWKIILKDYNEEQLRVFGETDTLAHTITLYRCPHKEFKESLASTLLHECMHAALHTSGATSVLRAGTEEGIVTALENALYPLIKSKLFSAS